MTMLIDFIIALLLHTAVRLSSLMLINRILRFIALKINIINKQEKKRNQSKRQSMLVPMEQGEK